MMLRLRQLLRKYWQDILTVAFLLVLSFLFPLIWLRGGLVVAGHDAGLPFAPVEHFSNRFYVWTERIGFGADQSHELGAVPIHGFEAIIALLIPNHHYQQIVVFAFWLFLPGLAMYVMMRGLFGKRFWFANLFATLFYSYNHFLLQSWWIFERTKYTLYAALPIVVLILYRFFSQQDSVLKSAIALSLTLFLLNGGGFVPLFGAIIVTVFFGTAFFLYYHYSRPMVIRLGKFFLLTFVVSVPLNTYWLLPYFILLQESFNTGLASIGGVKSVLEWANYISSEASLFNLFRLQGIIDWTGNIHHPYANAFQHNPLLLVIGFSLAPLAFLATILPKDKRDKLILIFFASLACVSMVFIGGTHKPSGFIFGFLIQNIPGFVVFRTPYYKFAPALWLSYSVLIGYTLGFFYQKLTHRLILRLPLQLLFSVGVFLLLAVYNYPYFSGIFFDYMKGIRTTRIKVPSYIYEINNYIKQTNPYSRMFLLPRASNSLNADAFIWQYWSLAPVTSLLSNNFTISNRNNDTELEIKLVDDLYKAFTEANPVWQKILYVFGPDTAVLRRDFAIKEDDRSPADMGEYTKLLSQGNFFQHIKTIGMWDFYDINRSETLPTITALPSTVKIDGYFSKTPYLVYADFLSLFSLRDINKTSSFVATDFAQNKAKNFLPNETYIAPVCSGCSMLEVFDPLDIPPRILPNSIFFPYVKAKEEKMLKAVKDPIAKEQLYLEILKNRTMAVRELRRMHQSSDQFIKTELLLQQAIRNLLTSVYTPSLDVNLDTQRMHTALEILYVTKAYIIYRLQDNVSDKERPVLDSLVNEIDDGITQLLVKSQKVTNENEKKYRVAIDNEGQYDILLNRKTLSTPDGGTTLSALSLNIDNKTIPLSPRNVGGDWYVLATQPISPGQHTLTLTDPNIANLFSIKEESKKQHPDATFGDQSVSFTASALEQKCFIFPVTNLEPGEVYKFSFTYQILDLYRRMIYKLDEKPFDYALLVNKGHYITPTAIEQTFEEIDTVPNSTMYLHFCSEYGINKNIPRDAAFIVKNISVKKYSSPKILLHKQDAQVSDIPVTYFERINPTQYHVRVINNGGKPFLFSFAERFNSQWKLYPVKTDWGFYGAQAVNPELPSFQVKRRDQYFDKNFLKTFGAKPVPEKQHLLINAYANGWWLTDTGAHDYILLYDKQKRYYLGALITLTAVVCVLTFLAFRWLKKSRS